MLKSVWTGELSFGLVSIPISLISAIEKNELHFHLLDAKTKARVRYQRINEETGALISWENIIKGYEYEKDQYIVVNESAFEKASPDLFKSITIEEFVNLKEIDSLFFNKAYYLIPESKNKKSYVLLKEALKNTQKVGVAKIIIRTKESLCVIAAHEHALMLYLLHYQTDIRQETEVNIPKEDIKTFKISPKEIKMAEALIKDMTEKWEPEKYRNEYQETLKKWLDQEIVKDNKKTKKFNSNSNSKRIVKSKDSVVDFISLFKESMGKKNCKVKTKAEAKTITKKSKH